MKKELFEPCEMMLQTLVDVITTSGTTLQNYDTEGEYEAGKAFEYDTQGN